MFALSFVSGILFFYGFSDAVIAVFFFPIFEELFKYLAVKYAPKFGFGMIVSYAIFEFILAKFPVFDSSLGSYNIDIALFSLFSIGFHVCTAIFYTDKALNNKLLFGLFAMILCHILYNGIGELEVSRLASLLIIAIFAISPLFCLYLFRKLFSIREN
jgi:hypothetical protein